MNVFNKIVLKTPKQINGIRRSCQTAVNMLKQIKDYIVPGITTAELNLLLDMKMRRINAIPATLNYKGYPASCCISVNNGICHGVPNAYALRFGDVVKIDVTTIVDGYFGDTCYTWIVGTPDKSPYAWTSEMHKIVSVARQCCRAGIEAIKPGKPLGIVSRAVRLTADAFGCSVVYQFCGHGVGLEFHEPPEVSYNSLDGDFGPIMQPGMIFTVEPMITNGQAEAFVDVNDGWSAYTMDGSLSAQFEHTVLVCESGYEILTDWGDEKDFEPNLKLTEGICPSH